MFRLTVIVAVVDDGFCRKILVIRPPPSYADMAGIGSVSIQIKN